MPGGPGQWYYGQPTPPTRGGNNHTVLIVVIALLVVAAVAAAFLLLRPRTTPGPAPSSSDKTACCASPTATPVGKSVEIAHGVALTVPNGWEVTKQDSSVNELMIGSTSDDQVFYAAWVDYSNYGSAAEECQSTLHQFAAQLTDVRDLTALPPADAPSGIDAASCAVSGTSAGGGHYDYYLTSYLRDDGLAVWAEFGVSRGGMTGALTSQFHAFDQELVGQLPQAIA